MLSDDVREKKRGCVCVGFYCLGCPTLIEVCLSFSLSRIFKFPSKVGLVVCGCRVAEEEKDDDDDEFKEEIRTTKR